MVYKSITPELHIDWVNIALWSLEFIFNACACVTIGRILVLSHDLIEDQVNEWDYCKIFRWWAWFELPLCIISFLLFFLHGTWYLFLPHAAFTAYLVYIVYANGEGNVDPTKVHITRDQNSQYWRLAYRATYYVFLLMACTFGLVYTVSHMYVTNPKNIVLMHKLLAGWFGPVFSSKLKYGARL